MSNSRAPLPANLAARSTTTYTAPAEAYPRLLPPGARGRLQPRNREGILISLRLEVEHALRKLRTSKRNNLYKNELWACCWSTLDPEACASQIQHALDLATTDTDQDSVARQIKDLARQLHIGISHWLSRRTATSTTLSPTSSVTPSTPDTASFASSSTGTNLTSQRSISTPRPDDTLVHERDKFRCLVTQATDQVMLDRCHIFAYALGRLKELSVKEEFWKFLQMFGGPETTSRVQQYLLGTEDGSERTHIKRLENMITLSAVAHRLFDSGSIILEPVGDPIGSLAPGQPLTSYDVMFSYVRGDAQPSSGSPGTCSTTTPQNVSACLPYAENNSLELRTSGQLITLTTVDPERLPLPHPDLLTMHAAISKLLKMVGRSGPRDLNPFENNPSDTTETVLAWRKQVTIQSWPVTSSQSDARRSSFNGVGDLDTAAVEDGSDSCVLARSNMVCDRD